MKHIKIIKDERGKFEIEVSLWIVRETWEGDPHGNTFRYDVYVRFTPSGKRKDVKNNCIEMVTAEQILEAKTEFWNSIKPV